MTVFNEPTKWATTLGQTADVANIPDTAGETDPSIDKIFPSVFSVPLKSGGKAVPRTVLNALFKLLGDWCFYSQNGGLASYDADFDYAVGRIVLYDNDLYKCIQANGKSSTVVAPDSVSPAGTDYWDKIAQASAFVDLTSAQTISGLKTFTTLPQSSVTPTNDDDFITKKYFEDNQAVSLIPNQIITSPVPLTDANLHLLDGSLLSGSGVYADYVSMMADLYADDPTATCWTDEATWQTSNTNYGFCNKFVYDSVANTVRLPKVNSLHGALIKSYHSGTEWYRIYEDGFCEQGGQTSVASTNGTATVSLLKPYSNTNYFAECSRYYDGANTSYTESVYKETNSVLEVNNNGGLPSIFLWSACGYIDISDLQVSPIYEYIVVGTVSKTQIQIDIDNVMTDLANKADKDFSNVTAPTQAFKNMSVGWGMPDYDSEIDISSSISTINTSKTISQDSLLKFEAGYTGAGAWESQLFINDVLFAFSNGYGGKQTVYLPIKAGTYNIRVSANFVSLKVIPLIGVTTNA